MTRRFEDNFDLRAKLERKGEDWLCYPCRGVCRCSICPKKMLASVSSNQSAQLLSSATPQLAKEKPSDNVTTQYHRSISESSSLSVEKKDELLLSEEAPQESSLRRSKRPRKEIVSYRLIEEQLDFNAGLENEEEEIISRKCDKKRIPIRQPRSTRTGNSTKRKRSMKNSSTMEEDGESSLLDSEANVPSDHVGTRKKRGKTKKAKESSIHRVDGNDQNEDSSSEKERKKRKCTIAENSKNENKQERLCKKTYEESSAPANEQLDTNSHATDQSEPNPQPLPLFRKLVLAVGSIGKIAEYVPDAQKQTCFF